MFGDVLLGHTLLGDALLGHALLGDGLLGHTLLGDVLLGHTLLGVENCRLPLKHAKGLSYTMALWTVWFWRISAL